MSTMLSLLSELEKHFISQRTKEALRVCKSAGVKLGRPKGRFKRKQPFHRAAFDIDSLQKNYNHNLGGFTIMRT